MKSVSPQTGEIDPTAAPACSADPLPKALIISESPFSLFNGFGVTLGTLFQGWRPERLVQFYTSTPASISREVCRKIYRAHVPMHRSRRYAIPFALGLIPEWRGQYSRRWLGRRLAGWRPDLVYSMSHSFTTVRYAAWVAKTLGYPHLLHIADDCLTTTEPAEVAEVCAAAALRLAISEEMRAVYRQRYQLDFRVLHNGAAEEILAESRVKPPAAGGLLIRYLGSIVPRHHFQAMEDIVQAVQAYEVKEGLVSFEIYGGDTTERESKKFTDGRRVFYGGPVSRAEGFSLLRTADLLVIPATFAREEYDQVRLSFPTKLPDYLASGSPTFVYGPEGMAAVEFCRRHKVGWVQTIRSVPQLLGFLGELEADRERFRQRAAADREFSRQHLSAEAVRSAFRGFAAAVGPSNSCPTEENSLHSRR